MIRLTRPLYLCGRSFNILQNVQQPVRTCVVQNFRSEQIQPEENKDSNKKKDNKHDDMALVNLAFSRIEAPEASEAPEAPTRDSSKIKLVSTKSHTSVNDSFLRKNSESEKVTTVSHIGNNVDSSDFSAESKTMSCVEAVQLLISLSYKKVRPVPLLKNICENICFEAERLSLKECSKVLYCLASLSFANKVLIDKIASVILSKSSEFYSGSLPASILMSLSSLRYNENELTDCLVSKIISLDRPKKLEFCVSAVISAAKLNYMSPCIKNIINELLQLQESDFPNTKSYLDFVWACVLLNELSNKHISIVLSEKFINQLHIIEGTPNLYETTNLKLLNINAAAKYLLSSYDGPFFKTEHKGLLFSKTKLQLIESVVDGLSYIFPKKEYLNINENTGAGFRLEVECFLNSKGSPVPLSMNKKEAAYKIGIVLLDFNDFCLNGELSLTGISSFKERILTARGYTVVSINYKEYNNSLKLFHKVQYLREKLQSAIRV